MSTLLCHLKGALPPHASMMSMRTALTAALCRGLRLRAGHTSRIHTTAVSRKQPSDPHNSACCGPAATASQATPNSNPSASATHTTLAQLAAASSVHTPPPVYSTATREALGFDKTIPIERARTPSSFWYNSRDFALLERNRVWGRSWVPVCHSAQLNQPGDYVCGSIAGQPFLVVKPPEGPPAAYYNVCRHHAATLIQSDLGNVGPEACIVCPYHGWTYGLDGRLKKATRIKGITEFSAKTHGLKPIASHQVGPMIFINFDANADDASRAQIERDVAPAFAALNPTGWDGLKFLTRKSYTLNCNWKIFAENYLDGGYHVSYLHGDLFSQLDSSTYRTEVYDKCSIQSVASADPGKKKPAFSAPRQLPNAQAKGEDFVERIGGNAVYAFMYPSLMINRYGDWMDINYALPLTETTCLVIMDYFLSHDAAASKSHDFVEKSLRASHNVQMEDVMICEAVQKGVSSAAYDDHAGRYAPGVEQALYHFHQMLATELERQ